MNLRYLRLLFILLACSLLVAACGGKKVDLHIPDDVHFVVSVNTKALQTKSKDISKVFDKEFLKNMAIPQKDLKEIEEAFNSLLKSGLDFNQKVYVYGKLAENSDDLFVGVSFGLKDGKSFETALKKATKKGNEMSIKKDNDITFAFPKDDKKVKEKILIAWKGSTALMLVMGKKGSTEQKAKEIFKIKADESALVKLKELKEMESKSYDVGFWLDYKQLNKITQKDNEQMLEMYNLPNIKKFAEVTTQLTGGMNFENGQVILNSDTYLDPSKSKLYESMLKAGINQTIVKNIPIQAPQIMFGFAFALKPFYDLIKDAKPLKETEENTIKTVGLKNDELVEMLTGDMMLAVKNLKIGEAIGGSPDPEAVVVLGVAKKDLFEKMMKNGEAFKDFKKEGNYYVFSPAPSISVFVILKDDGVYVVGSKDMREAILKGKGKLDGEHLALAKNNSSLLYLDFKFFEQLKMILGANPILDITLAELKTLTLETSIVKNHKIVLKSVLKLNNTKENSLFVLIDMAKKIALEESKKQKEADSIKEEPEEGMEKPLEEEKIEEPKESL